MVKGLSKQRKEVFACQWKQRQIGDQPSLLWKGVPQSGSPDPETWCSLSVLRARSLKTTSKSTLLGHKSGALPLGVEHSGSHCDVFCFRTKTCYRSWTCCIAKLQLRLPPSLPQRVVGGSFPAQVLHPQNEGQHLHRKAPCHWSFRCDTSYTCCWISDGSRVPRLRCLLWFSLPSFLPLMPFHLVWGSPS